MQSLSAQVSAINTVCYSNHTGYKQIKGRKVPAEEVLTLFEGLQQSYLTDFDVLLSGYVPSAEAVEAVGKIARHLKHEASLKPGSFFWVLDPVMGDNGRLYIPEPEVPAYKALLRDADLILPNQFEAELLSEVQITDLLSLSTAIKTLHTNYGIPHIVVTSLRISKIGDRTLPSTVNGSAANSADEDEDTLSVVGSSATSTGEPRLWRIDIPALPIFFSGTGDMFAALTVVRLREAASEAGLLDTKSWQSPEDVAAADTPLAQAAAKVLASMQAVLAKTYEVYKAEASKIDAELERAGRGESEEANKEQDMKRHLKKTKAAEVNVVRNVKDLLDPPEVEKYKARALEI
jgi:pyridoxine kinase